MTAVALNSNAATPLCSRNYEQLLINSYYLHDINFNSNWIYEHRHRAVCAGIIAWIGIYGSAMPRTIICHHPRFASYADHTWGQLVSVVSFAVFRCNASRSCTSVLAIRNTRVMFLFCPQPPRR